VGLITRNILVGLLAGSVFLALMGLIKWYGFDGPMRVAGTDSHVTFGLEVSDGIVVLALGLTSAAAAAWQLRKDNLYLLAIGVMVVACTGAFVVAYRGITVPGEVCLGSSWSGNYPGISCTEWNGGDVFSGWEEGRVLPPLWIALGLAAIFAILSAALSFIDDYCYERDDEGARTDIPKTRDGALQW
jgi:hypothetical protein